MYNEKNISKISDNIRNSLISKIIIIPTKVLKYRYFFFMPFWYKLKNLFIFLHLHISVFWGMCRNCYIHLLLQASGMTLHSLFYCSQDMLPVRWLFLKNPAFIIRFHPIIATKLNATWSCDSHSMILF